MHKCLDPLLQNSPLSKIKLAAAWDSFSDETIMNILHHLGELSSYTNNPLLEKALDHKNAYIRYLAAKRLIPYSSNKEIKEKISNDPSPLVNQLYKRFNDRFNTLPSIAFEHLWPFDHVTRLNIVAEVNPFFKYSLSDCIDLIKDANTNKVDLQELNDVIEEFMHRSNFCELSCDFDELQYGMKILNEKNYVPLPATDKFLTSLSNKTLFSDESLKTLLNEFYKKLPKKNENKYHYFQDIFYYLTLSKYITLSQLAYMVDFIEEHNFHYHTPSHFGEHFFEKDYYGTYYNNINNTFMKRLKTINSINCNGSIS